MTGPYRTPKNYAVMAYEQGWTTPAYFCESVCPSVRYRLAFSDALIDFDLACRCFLSDN